MFRLGLGLVLTKALLGSLVFAQARRYNIGREATPDEIRARDISVSPGGSGLPPGRGTPKEGRLVYQTKCSICHGDRGKEAKIIPRLSEDGALWRPTSLFSQLGVTGPIAQRSGTISTARCHIKSLEP